MMLETGSKMESAAAIPLSQRLGRGGGKGGCVLANNDKLPDEIAAYSCNIDSKTFATRLPCTAI